MRVLSPRRRRKQKTWTIRLWKTNSWLLRIEGCGVNLRLQEDRESTSRLEEAIKKEKARFLRAYKEIQVQERELSEKTLALEKSLTAEKYLRSCL